MPRPPSAPMLFLPLALLLGCQGSRDEGRHVDPVAPPGEPVVLQAEQVRVQAREDMPLVVPTEGAPARGPADAPVTLVEVTSFACPFCLRARETLKRLEEIYGDRLRIATRVRLVGDGARAPALAACAAHRQGKFHAYAELLWQEAALDGKNFAPDHLAELAGRAGLEVERFRADAAGVECGASVDREDGALRELGLGATPTWVINGRVIRGARDLAFYREMIDGILAPAGGR